jgi:hypothetical protein
MIFQAFTLRGEQDYRSCSFSGGVNPSLPPEPFRSSASFPFCQFA